MALATWWAGDPIAALDALPQFTVRLEMDDTTITELNHISLDEAKKRRADGHRPYIGFIGDMPVTYGWVASRMASIGELKLDFAIPADTRYLWDFATVSHWQGHGLYPRLLQSIVQLERAERFWIIHAPENVPSGAGMQKAGFQAVGQLSFLSGGTVGLIPLQLPERAAAGAELLGVPLVQDELSPCWRCMDTVVCTCRIDPAQCSCAVQKREPILPVWA